MMIGAIGRRTKMKIKKKFADALLPTRGSAEAAG